MAGGRCALVLCDMQPDALTAIPEAERGHLIELSKVCVEGARAAGWLVVFSGLRFPAGYEGIDEGHRLFGAFRRLHSKMGDGKARWFMSGWPGAEIEPAFSPQLSDVRCWRSSHQPSRELTDTLRNQNVTKVAVLGVKAAYAVQATCQVFCDAGLHVYAIRECIEDENKERLKAMLEHLLPVYAEVVTWEDFLLGIGMERLVEDYRSRDRHVQCGATQVPSDSPDGVDIRYCTDCQRGGHGKFFCQILLERPDWRPFPTQTWYQDQYWKEYLCPESRRVVDFADEPQFSRIAMYLKGRVWLEDKTKLLSLAREFMPDTFILDNGSWVGKALPSDEECLEPMPWFVKQADRNWGLSIRCFHRPSDCLAGVEPGARYVVQRHVSGPKLTDDGRKCHIKFYNLVVASEDGSRWSLYTYKDGYACVSPNRWTPHDASAETQITIVRSERLTQFRGLDVWPSCYEGCKEVVAEVVGRAVRERRLEGRDGQRQFEIFSADFVLDTSGRAWLLEFNFDPVLREGDRHVHTDDVPMVRAALSIVMPWEGGDPGLWDLAGEFSTSGSA